LELKIDSQNLVELLQANKKLIDETISNFLPRSSGTKEIEVLYEMMRDYPSRGGKGIRGSLCLLWCELFSGRKRNAVLTAAALELFQNWILVHDDIEDASEIRRGLPTLHKKYGVELAINAGDALHGKMWELVLKNRGIVGINVTLDILLEFTRMLNETTEGQQMELAWTSSNDWEIEESDYLLMVTKKAAWYTCISPCRLGLLLSSMRRTSDFSEKMDKVIEFGTNLGIAFQIVDDILNLTADESKYGKEILGDLYEGKRTLILLHLLKNLAADQREKVVEALSKPRLSKTDQEVKWIFQLMKDKGSIDYARAVAADHSANAMNVFEQITKEPSLLHPRIYEQTRSLLEYLTSRDY
jgi:geranylgeranyl diphosphate synthase, type II